MSLYRTRRTIKPPQMDPTKEVPQGLLREILEDAHWAPTHGLTQPWRLHVFTDGARAGLAAALVEIYDRITPEAVRQEEKREKMRQAALAAPVAVAVLAYVEPAATRKIPEIEEIVATSCAAENLMLSAHGHGLGSFWATPPAACSQDFIAWLGLSPVTDYRALGLIYLGYPQDGMKAISTRVPLEERVVFHSA